jgi:hypothetical protein
VLILSGFSGERDINCLFSSPSSSSCSLLYVWKLYCLLLGMNYSPVLCFIGDYSLSLYWMVESIFTSDWISSFLNFCLSVVSLILKLLVLISWMFCLCLLIGLHVYDLLSLCFLCSNVVMFSCSSAISLPSSLSMSAFSIARFLWFPVPL